MVYQDRIKTNLLQLFELKQIYYSYSN